MSETVAMGVHQRRKNGIAKQLQRIAQQTQLIHLNWTMSSMRPEIVLVGSEGRVSDARTLIDEMQSMLKLSEQLRTMALSLSPQSQDDHVARERQDRKVQLMDMIKHIQDPIKFNTQLDELTARHTTLSRDYDRAQVEISQMQESLRKKTREYKGRMVTVTSMVHTLRKDNERLEQQHEAELRQRRQTQSQLAELQAQVEFLSAEKSRLEGRYNELQRSVALEALTAHDIARWIVSIDSARFEKYHDELVRNMVSDGVDGQCLASMDKNDLKGLGVTSFKDRRDILSAMQKQMKQYDLQTKCDKLSDDIAASKECLVCKDADRTYAFLPCGHLCVCSECKEEDAFGDACPLCGTQSERVVRIYL